MQLKVKIPILTTILHFKYEVIRYYILLLIFQGFSFAQENETVIYFENEIHEVKNIHNEQITVKPSQKETLYVTESTPFYADASLVASIKFIPKKEEKLKNTPLTKEVGVNKVVIKETNPKKTELKYKKNTLPFTAEWLYKNGITTLFSSSNTISIQKNKNSIAQPQICCYYIALLQSIAPKNTKNTKTVENVKTLKEGIATYKRPPPMLFV